MIQIFTEIMGAMYFNKLECGIYMCGGINLGQSSMTFTLRVSLKRLEIFSSLLMKPIIRKWMNFRNKFLYPFGRKSRKIADFLFTCPLFLHQ